MSTGPALGAQGHLRAAPRQTRFAVPRVPLVYPISVESAYSAYLSFSRINNLR